MRSARTSAGRSPIFQKQRENAKRFYAQLADACERAIGIRAFVPNEHYDPIKHAHFTPRQVDAAERAQVCEHTSHLIVVPLAPSWGGGIEVEMAHQSGVPAILLCEKTMYEARRISRLLRGNAAIKREIVYANKEEAIKALQLALQKPIVRASAPW